MNVEYLIQLLDNKLGFLRTARAQAVNTGDFSTINTLEEEIVGVQDTLVKLRLLQSLTNAAANSGNTEVQVVATGIEAIKNNPIMSDNPTACMTEYDISTYATDPLHEQKIADILNYMGAMNSPADIDLYLSNQIIACPLNGSMIFNAALKYAVDSRLLMAIMELDSHFGTAGIAITTFNPGNVGNTGTATRTYSSWEAGVEAVASWLDKHRVNPLPVTPEVTPPEPVVEELIPIVPVVDTPPEEIIEPTPPESIVEPVPETPPLEVPTSTEPVLPIEPVKPTVVEEPVILDIAPVSRVKTKASRLIAKASPVKINIRKIKK
jgi:hypothetical protein